MNPYEQIPETNHFVEFLPRLSRARLLDGLDVAVAHATANAYIRRLEGRHFVGCFIGADDPANPDWSRAIARYDADAFRREVHAEKAEDRFRVQRGIGNGQRAISYNFALRLLPSSLKINQITGNCTAASLKKLCTQLLGMLILQGGEAWRLRRPYGTALTYSLRGHAGQGQSLESAARAVMTQGTQWLMRYVTDRNVYDLTDDGDDQRAGMRWGRSGPPADLVKITRQYPLIDAAPIDGEDPQWIKDFLQSGGLIHTGSTLSGADVGDPICRLRTIGSHAQTVGMYDDTDELRRYLRDVARLRVGDDDWFVGFHQTWGVWNEITNYPFDLWGPRPEGMWYTHWTDAMRIIRQGAIAYKPTLQAERPEELNWELLLLGA